MSRTHGFVIITLVVILGIAAVVTWRVVSTDGQATTPTGAAALSGTSSASTDAQATYTTVSGDALSLDTYRDGVVVVTTWASWCPQCRDSLAVAEAAAAELAPLGVPVLAINRTESPERISRYLAGLPEYEHLVLIRDTADHFYDTTGGYAMPETVVIDADGAVVKHMRGMPKTSTIVEAARRAAGEQ